MFDWWQLRVVKSEVLLKVSLFIKSNSNFSILGTKPTLTLLTLDFKKMLT